MSGTPLHVNMHIRYVLPFFSGEYPTQSAILASLLWARIRIERHYEKYICHALRDEPASRYLRELIEARMNPYCLGASRTGVGCLESWLVREGHATQEELDR